MPYWQKNFLLAAIVGFVLTVVLLKSGIISGHWYLWWIPLFLISLPFTTKNGNVISLWGGAAPGHVFSLCSIYQDAGGLASSFFGVSLYQKGADSLQIVGLSVYQRATEGDAVQIFGVCLYQKAAQCAVQIMGLLGVQIAHHDAMQGLGLIGLQQAGEESYQFFGASIHRKSDLHYYGGLFTPRLSWLIPRLRKIN